MTWKNEFVFLFKKLGKHFSKASSFWKKCELFVIWHVSRLYKHKFYYLKLSGIAGLAIVRKKHSYFPKITYVTVILKKSKLFDCKMDEIEIECRRFRLLAGFKLFYFFTRCSSVCFLYLQSFSFPFCMQFEVDKI